MQKTQVDLTDEQVRRLRELAERDGRTIAEEIRESVDTHIAQADQDREALWERTLAAIGKFPGPADIAINHDEYYVRSIEEHIEENRR